MQKTIHKPKITIGLENIRSLYNIGSIIRTCEFFGINNIAFIGYSGIDKNEPDMIHSKLKKTALSSINNVVINTYENTEILLNTINYNQVIGIENNIKGTTNLYSYNPPSESQILLLFGNEKTGLEDKTIKSCDLLLEIDRIGNHSSLNVSTVAGIVISHIIYKVNYV